MAYFSLGMPYQWAAKGVTELIILFWYFHVVPLVHLFPPNLSIDSCVCVFFFSFFFKNVLYLRESIYRWFVFLFVVRCLIFVLLLFCLLLCCCSM